jgi:nickel-dependent lactate racemase
VKRRDLLAGAAAGICAGGAPSWSRAAARAVAIPTREHYGDTEELLAVPGAWDLTVHDMPGARSPVLTPAQIRARLEAPIASKRLADLARGKRTAIITFDDLTRATPTGEVLPHVIAELKLGGIPDEGIALLASYGSHRPLDQQEVTAKLGPQLADKYPWLNHNAFENLADVGKTSRGNRIKINRHFLDAEVRVTVSGMKGHLLAGFGGGAKAILPGIAGIDAIDYLHRTIGRNNPRAGYLKVFKNDCRLDMIEAARLARVDFGVQITYNGRRKVIGLHAGDIVEAHHAACREANRLLGTETAKGADVVVVNAYPQNLQAPNQMGWLRSGLRDGGTAVLIVQNPQGLESWHYAIERWEADDRRFYETAHPKKWAVAQAGQLVVYSAYMQERSRRQFPAGTLFTRTWAETVAAIGKRHREAKVALYPYAGVQHAAGPLDG